MRWASMGAIRPDYRAILLRQIKREGLVDPKIEYQFHPDRKWRLDIAWPIGKIAVEVEGMAHRTRERFMADIEKYNELTIGRWRLIRIYTRWIATEKREMDTGINLIRRVFDD